MDKMINLVRKFGKLSRMQFIILTAILNILITLILLFILKNEDWFIGISVFLFSKCLYILWEIVKYDKITNKDEKLRIPPKSKDFIIFFVLTFILPVIVLVTLHYLDFFPIIREGLSVSDYIEFLIVTISLPVIDTLTDSKIASLKRSLRSQGYKNNINNS